MQTQGSAQAQSGRPGESEQPDELDQLDPQGVGEPQPGAPVRLLPTEHGDERTGSLIAWSSSPAGLVATADVELSDDDAEAVVGRPVWASIAGPTGADGVETLVVLEAVASPLPGGGAVTLTGALALGSDRRRSALRVEAAVPVTIADERAQTIDLSRTGLRVSLPAASLPDQVRVELGLGEGDVVSTTAEVVRVDAASGEVALRFTGLTTGEAARIDRAVLSTLSAQR